MATCYTMKVLSNSTLNIPKERPPTHQRHRILIESQVLYSFIQVFYCQRLYGNNKVLSSI